MLLAIRLGIDDAKKAALQSDAEIQCERSVGGSKWQHDGHGAPEVMNAHQRPQSTSQAVIALLKEHGISISMDGNGCCFKLCNRRRPLPSFGDRLGLFSFVAVNRGSLNDKLEFVLKNSVSGILKRRRF